MTNPKYLYHATSNANFDLIKGSGLMPKSGKDGEPKYLCMSVTINAAWPIGTRGNHKILRVNVGPDPAHDLNLNPNLWFQISKTEWRGYETIPPGKLEYISSEHRNTRDATWEKLNLNHSSI